MDENIKQNPLPAPAPKPVSYSRNNRPKPNFFNKFFSMFSKKTTTSLVILTLVIGVGAATIAVQNSTDTRQRAASDSLIPGCGSLGDVNGDGRINSVDSSLILQYSAGKIQISGLIAKNADTNGDGQVNAIDSNLILQYSAGLISTFIGCKNFDTIPPTSVIKSPLAGSLQSSSSFTVGVTDSDTGGSGLSKCYYAVFDQGGPGIPLTERACNAPIVVKIGSTSAGCRTAGTNTCNVRIHAVDNAGNSGSPAGRDFSINLTTTTPGGSYSITLNQPTTSCSGTNSLVHLTWSTSGFSTNWFDISINGSYVTDNGSTGKFWNSGALNYNQSYTFRVANHDWDLTGGTSAQSNSRTITTLNCLNPPTITDTMPPTSVIKSPLAGSLQSSSSFTVGVTDSDTGGSGLSKCYYAVFDQGGPGIPLTERACNAPIVVKIGSTSAGCRTAGTNTCNVRIHAVDNAGNSGSPAGRDFSISLTTITPIISPSSNVISGTIFIDTNGDGDQDSGEADYSGNATIKLETGTTATKYGNGFYFTSVASGTHTVTLTEPSGYTKTTPTSVHVTVPPSPGTFKFGIKSTATTTPTTLCKTPLSLDVGNRYYGDVDGNDLVNATDSTWISQFVAGTRSFDQVQKEVADVNGPPNVLSSSSNVNAIDAALVLQYANNLISTFSVCSSSSTPIPNCNTGNTCNTCTAPTNTCGGSGTQTCTLTAYSGGGTCNQVSNLTTCNTAANNCNTGNTCQNNVCVAPTGNPTQPPSNPTNTPGGTQLALSIGLDAIGNTGDNGNRNDSSGSNKSPRRPTRNIIVELFNSSNNQPVGTPKTGNVTYANGLFTGNIDLGTGFAPGSYNIKIKSDGYLKRRILGVSLTTGVNTAPPIFLVVGDINGDNQLTIVDFNILISCSTFSTDNRGACNANPQYAILSDLEDNGAVNQFDYNLFLREYSVQAGD